MELNEDIKLFLAVVEANPGIVIHCSDINSLQREFREATGRRIIAIRVDDEHEHAENDYWRVNRVNRKRFSLRLEGLMDRAISQIQDFNLATLKKQQKHGLLTENNNKTQAQ